MENDGPEVMCSEDLNEEEVQAFNESIRSVFGEQAG